MGLFNRNEHYLYGATVWEHYICRRKDWRKCPKHKNLTDVRPTSETRMHANIADINTQAEKDLIDDPNDDIVSVKEYADSEEQVYKPKPQEDSHQSKIRPESVGTSVALGGLDTAGGLASFVIGITNKNKN